VMYRIVHEDPVALPSGAFAGLPADLGPVIATALAKDPADRFATAQQFRESLRTGIVPQGGGAAGRTARLPQVSGHAAAARPSAATIVYVVAGIAGALVIGGMLFSAGNSRGGGAPTSTANTQGGGKGPATSGVQTTVEMRVAPEGVPIAEGELLRVEAVPSTSWEGLAAVYVDGVSVETASAAPYSFEISPGPSGSHEVWVQLTDSAGQSVQSPKQVIAVISEEGIARDEINAMLKIWDSSLQNLDIDEHMGCYAGYVDPYFRSGAMSNDEIRDDKASAFAKFTSAQTALSRIDIELSGTDSAVVELDKANKFYVGSTKRVDIKVRQQLAVERQGTEWKIVSERDIKVY